jgi:hypothetical protein
MLNFTPATAGATAHTADAYAEQAVTRPLAGFGAGAFTRPGAWVGASATETAAVLALPRIKPKVSSAQAGSAGAACMTSSVDIAQVDAHNFIQMTRLYPITPGGVGPHPAREPVPV